MHDLSQPSLTETLASRATMHIQDSIALKQKYMQALAHIVSDAGQRLYQAILRGNKILCCGNGGSAADCQHFVAELVNRFEIERAPLAALSLTTDTSILTAIGNDYNYDLIFSKQVQALGKPGDILFAISTSGNSKNIIQAVHAAKERNMQIILLTGSTGGSLSQFMDTTDDLAICVPSSTTARIQETHILTIHCLCDAIDWQYQQQEEPCE